MRESFDCRPGQKTHMLTRVSLEGVPSRLSAQEVFDSLLMHAGGTEVHSVALFPPALVDNNADEAFALVDFKKREAALASARVKLFMDGHEVAVKFLGPSVAVDPQGSNKCSAPDAKRSRAAPTWELVRVTPCDGAPLMSSADVKRLLEKQACAVLDVLPVGCKEFHVRVLHADALRLSTAKVVGEGSHKLIISEPRSALHTDEWEHASRAEVMAAITQMVRRQRHGEKDSFGNILV